MFLGGAREMFFRRFFPFRRYETKRRTDLYNFISSLHLA